MDFAQMLANLTPWAIPYAVLAAWVVVISLISMIVCVYDKKISKKGKVELRIPEKVLFLTFPLLGGSVAMYLTMLAIRHKTKHWQMKVIPVIAFLQIAALIGITAVIALGII